MATAAAANPVPTALGKPGSASIQQQAESFPKQSGSGPAGMRVCLICVQIVAVNTYISITTFAWQYTNIFKMQWPLRAHLQRNMPVTE